MNKTKKNKVVDEHKSKQSLTGENAGHCDIKLAVAPWCGYSKQQLHALKKMRNALDEHNIKVIPVHCAGDLSVDDAKTCSHVMGYPTFIAGDDKQVIGLTKEPANIIDLCSSAP